MLKSRRIPHPTHQLLSHCISTLRNLYNEESSRIDFNTIDQLCEFLDVQVGDLFIYKPNNKDDEGS